MNTSQYKIKGIVKRLSLLIFMCVLLVGCKAKDPNLLTFSGVIEATEVNLNTKVSGRVLIVPEEGTIVKKGDVIVRLDDAELQAQYRQAKANFQAAERRIPQLETAYLLQKKDTENQITQAENNLQTSYIRLNQAVSSYQLQTSTTSANVAQSSEVLKGSLSRLQEAQLSLSFQKEQTYRQVKIAKANLNGAEYQLAKLVKGSRNQEIEASRQSILRAKADFELARLNLKRSKELYNKGAIPRQQLDNTESTFKTSQAQLKSAQESYSLVKEGTREEDIRIARENFKQAQDSLKLAEANKIQVLIRQSQLLTAFSQVQQSRASLRLAEASRYADMVRQKDIEAAKTAVTHAQISLKSAMDARLLVKIKEQELEIGRANLKQARATFELAEATLKNTVIASPINGVVTEKISEKGELVTPGMSMVNIADLEDIWVAVYVSEKEYGKIKLRQKVTIKVDSFPKETFEGRVIYIASKSEFTPKNIQTKEDRVNLTYKVKVAIKNTAQKLKKGMPADVEIRVNDSNT